jgi:hypothetical protein
MALTEAERKYQREYMRKRRLDPAFHKKSNEISRLSGIKRRTNNRAAWNLSRKAWVTKDRAKTRARLGDVCGFFDCGETEKLYIHHDHILQERQQCCPTARHGGCRRCQICLLCPKHNVMLGIMNDDIRIARQVVEFLEKYHGSSDTQVS